MTKHHEEEEVFFTPQPMQVPPNCDPEVSKAFLRRMHSPGGQALDAAIALYAEAMRRIYPDIPTADM